MSSYADRLKALREQLKAEKLDGFVVPLTDEHMSEYVGSYAQRLAWLTGFQGSAGSAVVLPEQAAIFVDGRYTLQVRSQVSATEWSYQSVPETSTTQWLERSPAILLTEGDTFAIPGVERHVGRAEPAISRRDHSRAAHERRVADWP